MTFVDPNCTVTNASVLDDYSCTLNQTDIKTNKNKFYIIQIIQSKNQYMLFTRYGRVGEIGKINIKKLSKDTSIADFKNTFKSKTGNTWGSPFVKKNNKYILMEIEKPVIESESGSDDDEKKIELDEEVENFMNMIVDKNMLMSSMKRMNIDTQKLPLGKISNKQINEAKKILVQINDLISDGNKKTNDSTNDSKLIQLSSEYYTWIPCRCSRSSTPQVINTKCMIDKFMEDLDELENIKEIGKITKNNNICNIYTSLCADITVLDDTEKIYKEIIKYINNTHCSTHFAKLNVKSILKVNRHNSNYDNSVGNETLLYHGSSMSNWASIIKNGLLLDPSRLGVKITGKMFGQGLYFANAVTKSYNYCNADGGIAVLALARVALGKQLNLTYSRSELSDKILENEGYDSTWGKGMTSPMTGLTIDGLKIPNGKMRQNAINSSLLYDEFIIYNTSRYRLEYLIVVENKK